jgi:hypothetical protein
VVDVVRLAVLAALAALVLVPSAAASPYVQFGVQDDAWLRFGPGTIDTRVATLQRLGVDVVRYTIDWREVSPHEGTLDWSSADAVLQPLRRAAIQPVVTLWGSPGWANGGRGGNWAPTNGATFAAFAGAAARRYPFVRRWLVWNEPNKAPFLRPTSAQVYVERLLNPAYAAIHAAHPNALVGGGVTGPIAGGGGVSPVSFIRSMQRYGARLDAYAHNPYPANPRRETPFIGGCGRCATITMATIEKLIALAGAKRVWLTEYAYQTDDVYLGVSRALQARYLDEAALRAYLAPRVDMLIHYMVRDDAEPAGWQSGLLARSGTAKPAYDAFRLPLAARGRAVWGQVRPRAGVQAYRLQRRVRGTMRWYGAVRRTDARGYFLVRVPPGTYRVWSPRDRAFSAPVAIG